MPLIETNGAMGVTAYGTEQPGFALSPPFLPPLH
jgi:hypothetical protein